MLSAGEAPGKTLSAAGWDLYPLFGSAAKNSFASLAITSGSGGDAMLPCKSPCCFASPGLSAGMLTEDASLILMVMIETNIFEYTDGVFSQNRQRTIK